MDREFSIAEGGLSFPLPKWRRVAQTIEAPRMDSIPEAVAREMRKIEPRVRPGMSVAVGVGSRGVARLAEIVRAVLAELKRLGARPFIVPAMGYHGGATPEGQLFLQQLIRMSDIDYAHFWIGAVFRGEASSAPRVIDSRNSSLCRSSLRVSWSLVCFSR